MASAAFGGFGVSFSLDDEFSSVAEGIRKQFVGLEDSTTSLADKVQASMSKITSGVALAGIGIAALAPLYMALDKASDLQESMTKNNVVFGESISMVTQFVNENAAAYGLSANAAYAATGVYGNLFTALGLGQQQAARYSVELTKLGADLASFNNTDIQTALDALKSGLTGETESLKKFGVAINEGLVKAQAFQMGLTKDIKIDLTPAQKMQATFELIMQQTKNAQGDFIRTGDGYANMTRKMSARIENFATKLGNIFLPIVEKGTKLMETFLVKLTEFSDTEAGKLIMTAGVIGIAIFALIMVFTGLEMVLGGVASAAWAAIAPFLPIIAAIAAVVGILAWAVGGFDNLKLVVEGLVAVFMSASSEGFSMSESLAAALENIGLLDFVVAMGTWFVRIKEFFNGVIDGFIEVYNVVATVFGVIWDIIKSVFSAISQVLDYFGISIQNNTSNLETWVMVGKIVAYVIGVIIVLAIISVISALWGMAVAWIAALWPVILIVGIVVGAIWLIWTVLEFLWDILKAIGSWLMSVFAPIINFIIAYYTIWYNILKWVAEVIWSVLKPALEFLGTVLMWIYDNGIKPLIDGFVELFETVGSWVDFAIDKITGFATYLWNVVSSVWNAGKQFVMNLWDGMKSAWGEFTAWFNKAWNDSMIGQALDMMVSGEINVDRTTTSGQVSPQVSPIGGNIAQNGLNSMAVANAQQRMPMQPIVNNTNSETVKEITIVTHLDGDEISKNVLNKQQLDNSRQH